MADVTGVLHEDFGGRSIRLRLTIGVLAGLQARHGNDLGGLLTGTAGDIPPFSIILDVVASAIRKGEGMPRDEADALADEMLTEDQKLVQRLMAAAFPDQAGKAAAAAAAAE